MPSSEASIDLPPIPAKVRDVSCKTQVLPKGPLTAAQVDLLWARDRATLVKCGYSRDGTLEYYDNLRARLAAAANAAASKEK